MERTTIVYPKDCLRGNPVKNCPLDLDVCYGSCWYNSLLAGKCVYPCEGAVIDSNISGDNDHSNTGGF